jgi:hypothetical protein
MIFIFLVFIKNSVEENIMSKRKEKERKEKQIHPPIPEICLSASRYSDYNSRNNHFSLSQNHFNLRNFRFNSSQNQFSPGNNRFKAGQNLPA